MSDDPDPSSTTLRAGWFPTFCRIGAWLGILLLGGATACMLLARVHWVFELSTHYRVHAVLGAVPVLALTLIGRTRVGAGVVLLLLGFHATSVAPAFLRPDPPPADVVATQPLRLLVVNVLTSNRQTRPLLDLIDAEDPDVILLMEVDADWVARLGDLHGSYPHATVMPRDDNFGIALFARIPDIESEVVELGSDLPSMIASFRHGGRAFTLLGTHPVPPVRSFLARQRDAQLEAVAARAAQDEGAVILAGDLNTTPWSPAFHDLIEAAGLIDTRAGFGIQTTWPAALPSLLRIPIDHVLVSPDVETLDRRIGPHVGGDHRPVIVDLR